jgi:hypothetical protein
MHQVCPICRRPGADIEQTVTGHKVRCQVCSGQDYFTVGRVLMSRFETELQTDKLRPYLSAYIRQHKGPAQVVLTNENWKAWAEGVQAIPVVSKIDGVLRLISDRSSYPGHLIELNASLDYPLTNAANSDELKFMLEYLGETKLIWLTQQDRPGFVFNAWVLAKGWERLQASDNRGIPGRCFVAMSFAETMDPAYALQSSQP